MDLLEFVMELFGSEKFDFIYSRIGYLIGVKSGITYTISHNYAEIIPFLGLENVDISCYNTHYISF